MWKLERLGRSLSHLVAVLSDLQGSGVAFLSLIEAIDTENAAGRLMGHILGALAEFECSLVVERTQAGLRKPPNNAAKKLGCKPSLSDDQRKHARELLVKGESPATVAKLLNVCHATLYNSLQNNAVLEGHRQNRRPCGPKKLDRELQYQ